METNKTTVGRVKASDVKVSQFHDAMGDLPIYAVPGKNTEGNWKPGEALEGLYVMSRRAYSDTADLRADCPFLKDKRFTTVHVLQSKGGERFQIWGTGTLNATLSRLKPETPVAILYQGKADKPFKEDQEPYHVFKFHSNGKPLNVDMSLRPRYQVVGLNKDELEELAAKANFIVTNAPAVERTVQ